MNMRADFRFGAVTALACFVTLCSCAQSAPVPDAETRAEKISALNSIDGTEMRPWHLKLSYQLADSNGKFGTDQGMIEEWWASPKEHRISFSQGADAGVYVTTADGDWHSENAAPIPTRATLLLAQVVHPVDTLASNGARPELREHFFGKLKAECVMFSQPFKGVKEIPLGLFPTYCVNDSDVLLLTWTSASISVVNTKMGKFLGHYIPTELNIHVNDKNLVQGTLTQLTTVAASAVELSTTGMVRGGADAARVSGGIMAGMIISKPQPVYPQSARQNHVSGTVVIRALIGTDGHIHRASIVSSPDGELSLSALIAVQQWTYKPYMLNGIPTSVDTTITVNYNIN